MGCESKQDCRLTYNEVTNRLYAHVLAYPFEQLHLPGFAEKVEYAQFLHDASELKMRTYEVNEHHSTMSEAVPSDILTVYLPVKKPNATIPVVELFLK